MALGRAVKVKSSTIRRESLKGWKKATGRRYQGQQLYVESNKKKANRIPTGWSKSPVKIDGKTTIYKRPTTQKGWRSTPVTDKGKTLFVREGKNSSTPPPKGFRRSNIRIGNKQAIKRVTKRKKK